MAAECRPETYLAFWSQVSLRLSNVKLKLELKPRMRRKSCSVLVGWSVEMQAIEGEREREGKLVSLASLSSLLMSHMNNPREWTG